MSGGGDGGVVDGARGGDRVAQEFIPEEIFPFFARPPILPREIPVPEEWGAYPKLPTEPPPGFIWRGRPGSTPGDGNGNYYNPNTGETLRPDMEHEEPIGPHWDYLPKRGGDWYRWFPDGVLRPKVIIPPEIA